MRISSAALVAGALALSVVAAPVAGDWRVAEPGYAWSFPRDHWSHPGYRTEWWYFTGHLEAIDDPQRRFGYQFTLFRVGLSPTRPELDSAWSAANLVMGHASLTDRDAEDHRFSELLYRETPFLGGFGVHPDPRIAWARAPAGTDGEWALEWNGGGFDLRVTDVREDLTLELSTRPLKPLVFQGPGGYSPKASGASVASLYYSFTRLQTEGTLTIDGVRHRVRGTSWMDREFSTSHLGEGQVGWDWFSLNLDDGRDLMLYLMRREDGSLDFGRGTVVSAQGDARYLEPGDWTLRITDRWKSDASGAVYPSGWTIVLPEERLRLTVQPVLRGQENIGELAGGLAYWEGAVDVLDETGAVVGRGYVELTGYGEANRPPV